MANLNTWHALGPALARLVASGERACIAEYHHHLRVVLLAGGVEEGDPLFMRVAAITPALGGAHLDMQASAGALGQRLRELYGEWRAADELYGMWRSVDEVLDDLDDPWESLGEELANSGPSTPDAALEVLGTLPVEIQAMDGEPFATWPLVATGGRQSTVLGDALGQLSERAGIPRETLPTVPVDLDDEPILVLTDAAQALERLTEWMLERQGRARTLGRLSGLLDHSEG